ncbi:MAG: MBL fold metallo-hydrolase [Bdellovibrionota bacterium]
MLELQFLGGAGTVTGSKFLLTYNEHRILIDCGLFQGLKALRLRNWEMLPVDPKSISCVILTHAHIDHSGYLPRLLNDGFQGPVYSTAATRDLCKILLPDCGYLMEEEASYLNQRKKTKHDPALPLFTREQGEKATEAFETLPFKKETEILPGVRIEFLYAGHILGAASVIVTAGDQRIAFTGDIGRPEDPILFPPEPLPAADFLVTESTYGNRRHKKLAAIDELELQINKALKRGGTILIPTFAVGRAQFIMYLLWKLRSENRIPNFPMFLNSPMATNVNDLLAKHKDLHKLSTHECAEVCNIVQYVRSPEESIALNKRTDPKLIISASGMISGGRILHHIKAFGPLESTTILLTGYQAAGTRGEALQNGAEELKIHGSYVPIKAHVEILDNVSAHADYREIIDWLKHSKIKPKKTFIVHGEASASDEIRRRLNEELGWECLIPEPLQTICLSP